MKFLYHLLRTDHWIKNLFIFFPLFFAGGFSDTGKLFYLALGFISFCCCASGIYILNDLADRKEDRMHPVKALRPVASGKVQPATALMTALTLITAGVLVAWRVDLIFLAILVVYVMVNLLYTYWLKHVAVIDVIMVSIGFVLRIVAGGSIANVFISQWIIAVTFLLAMFLALAKRRDDLLLLLQEGRTTRKSADGYNLEFINVAMIIMAAVVIVAYIMYTVSADVITRIGSNDLYMTAVFVVAGILKYLQLTLVRGHSGDPTYLLYKSRLLQLIILSWIIAFYLILY